MDDMLTTLKEVAGEDIANNMEALDLTSASDGVETTQSNLDRKVEVYGKAYKALVEFVEREEEKIAEMTGGKLPGMFARITCCMASRCGQRHPARRSTAGSTVSTGERSFEKDMVFASRVDSSTENVEVAWVRKHNKEAWETAVGSRPAP